MAQFVPLSPGLLRGQPAWVNLDQVTHVLANGNFVTFYFPGDCLDVDCGYPENVVKVLELLERAK